MNLEDVFFDLSNFEFTNKLLGEGTFGKVYIVKSLLDGKEYAAKIINFDGKFDGKDQMLFLRESLILHKIHHPSIVNFIGINLQSNDDPEKLSPTIITEYLSNGSLKQILDKEKRSIADRDWTPTKKYIVLLGISNAMKYLHKQGIIHRDLKPENILIDEYFNPRICDFGLSKCFSNSLSKSMQLSMTKNIGTPMYMAPELLQDDEDLSHYGSGIDVYAFGILAYEIVTGKEPYSELGKINAIKLALKVVSGYRPPISDDVPEKMKILILRCLSQKIEERPTFDEIFSKLSSDYSYFNEDVDEDDIKEYLEFLSENEEKEPIITKSEKEMNTVVNENKEKEYKLELEQKKKSEETYTKIIEKLIEKIQDFSDIKIDGINFFFFYNSIFFKSCLSGNIDLVKYMISSGKFDYKKRDIIFLYLLISLQT